MSLLNRIKSFFRVSDAKAAWDRYDFIEASFYGVNKMGATSSEASFASIENTGGKAVLKNARTGAVISVYSRERDARRGALRRGLSIIA